MPEFTGERVIPGEVDPDLLNEHVARYAFAARLSRGKRVLDAGCGTGYGSALLAKAATLVLGIDISSQAIEYASLHNPASNLRFAQASCMSLPLASGSVDLVVAFEVIEHLVEWGDFLNESRRVLAPGGQLVISTPNKRYYEETRARSGPNPFHVHEFEFEEFRDELERVFRHVSLYVQNHVEAFAFQPLRQVQGTEACTEPGGALPADSHFFIAVCANSPQTGGPAFVYLPRSANVLREREQHIEMLESELATKDQWLEEARREHQELVTIHDRQTAELEERNRWAERLNRELEAAVARIAALQEELEQEQAAAAKVVSDYEAKIQELERENERKTEWAEKTSRELADKCQELARCVDALHETEKTLEERTNWALRLQGEAQALEAKLNMVKASRWVRLGRTIGLGPELRES